LLIDRDKVWERTMHKRGRGREMCQKKEEREVREDHGT